MFDFRENKCDYIYILRKTGFQKTCSLIGKPKKGIRYRRDKPLVKTEPKANKTTLNIKININFFKRGKNFIMENNTKTKKTKSLSKDDVVKLVYKADKDFIGTDIDRVRIKTLKLLLEKFSKLEKSS